MTIITKKSRHCNKLLTDHIKLLLTHDLKHNSFSQLY